MSPSNLGNVFQSQAGSVFLATPVNVIDGFSTSFTFNFQDGAVNGGDGLAFVVQANRMCVI